MGNAKKPAKAESESVPKAESVSAPRIVKEAEFSIPALRKDCLKLFGVTTSTFDGAMAGRDGEYSVSAARKIIVEWGKEVAK